MFHANRFLGCSMLAASFAVLFTGCYARGPSGPTPPPVTCSGTLDDGVACTVDVCPAAGGAHLHIPSDGLCAAGQSCTATGCVSRDPACPASCDDGIACTVDSCVSGSCRHSPDDSACSESCTCNPGHADADSRGCVSPPDGPGPTVPGFHCVYTDGAHRIGYAVRVRSSGMTGVRTIPSNTGETRAMSASQTRLWALGTTDGSIGGGGVDTGSDGWTTYSLVGTAGGRINTHPFQDRWLYGAPAYDRDILNIADLRSFAGMTCDDVGIDVQVCMNPSGCVSSGWVDLPARFCVIGPDTVARPFWNDPVIAPELRNTVVTRAVITTDGSNDTATCAPVSR